MDTVSYPVPSLPSFKGNTDAAKYQCILVDGAKNRVLDILPDRKQADANISVLHLEQSVTLRKYYKRSRKLILTRYKKLQDDNKEACDLMLMYNEDLRQAHRLKEEFYSICQHEKYSYQRSAFWSWVKEAESCGIPEFQKCAKTYRTWSALILNAFKYRYTNGPTEGFNNKIKVLKRTSYGVRNFKRFRTRILHSTN